LSFCRFSLAIILYVLLSFSFGHYINGQRKTTKRQNI
jgi:hypothetical protein